jgi:hypothetical protein
MGEVESLREYKRNELRQDRADSAMGYFIISWFWIVFLIIPAGLIMKFLWGLV